MRPVRWVKRAAEHADAPLRCGTVRLQTQSRRTRNLLYNAASGVPATGTFW